MSSYLHTTAMKKRIKCIHFPYSFHGNLIQSFNGHMQMIIIFEWIKCTLYNHFAEHFWRTWQIICILLLCAFDWIVNIFVLCTISKISTTFSAYANIKLSKWIHWTGLEGREKAKKYLSHKHAHTITHFQLTSRDSQNILMAKIRKILHKQKE